jgi:hypothetical protein
MADQYGRRPSPLEREEGPLKPVPKSEHPGSVVLTANERVVDRQVYPKRLEPDAGDQPDDDAEKTPERVTDAASHLPLELGQLRLGTVQGRLVLDRTLEHLHGLGLVALFRADLAQIVEDLALGDPDARIEPLEK